MRASATAEAAPGGKFLFADGRARRHAIAAETSSFEFLGTEGGGDTLWLDATPFTQGKKAVTQLSVLRGKLGAGQGRQAQCRHDGHRCEPSGQGRRGVLRPRRRDR
ncbi:MAG: hypothetical protein ACJ8J7_04120 [Sulfurifustaceae bacterium]